MKKIVQHLMLSAITSTRSFFLLLLTILICQGCSKNDVLAEPVKPLQVARTFQFNVAAGDQFDEETSRSISVKLRLSISAFTPGINAKQVLWDTLISSNSLYHFTHETSQPITTTLRGPEESLQHLLFGYVIIYNNHGALLTRSETAGVDGNEAGKLIVKL